MLRAPNHNPANLASRPPHHALRASAVALATLAVAVTVTACGGGSPGVANLGGSHGTSSNAGASTPGASAGGGPASTSAGGLSVHTVISAGSRKAALKFARCMRANGVSDFPDPSANGTFQFSGGSGGGVDPRLYAGPGGDGEVPEGSANPTTSPAQLQARGEGGGGSLLPVHAPATA